MKRVSSIIRKTPFRYADRWLFRPRLSLYTDHLELTGWHWRGRHHRDIDLADITRLQWWSGTSYDVNLALHLQNDEHLRLWVKGPGLWKFKIAEHAPNLEKKTQSSGQDVLASAA